MGYSLWGCKELDTTERLSTHSTAGVLLILSKPFQLQHCLICSHLLSLSEKAVGTPLQYSRLENPMDGGTWKAAVHGVAEGQT